MLLSPAELREMHQDHKITYFQPGLKKLEEALLIYRFTPVRFDYNHIKEGDTIIKDGVVKKKFKPTNKDSKRVYINSLVERLSDELRLNNGRIS